MSRIVVWNFYPDKNITICLRFFFLCFFLSLVFFVVGFLCAALWNTCTLIPWYFESAHFVCVCHCWNMCLNKCRTNDGVVVFFCITSFRRRKYVRNSVLFTSVKRLPEAFNIQVLFKYTIYIWKYNTHITYIWNCCCCCWDNSSSYTARFSEYDLYHLFHILSAHRSSFSEELAFIFFSFFGCSGIADIVQQ